MCNRSLDHWLTVRSRGRYSRALANRTCQRSVHLTLVLTFAHILGRESPLHNEGKYRYMKSTVITAARTTVISVLLVLFVGSFGWGAYVHIHYSRAMPHSPDPKSDRVHEFVINHGEVVYVTEKELWWAESVQRNAA